MTRAARVVPDVGSFSVDEGFWYRVPEHLGASLHIGSIVRVPLSGRKVRGWVVDLQADREGDLKEVAGVSGVSPVFDAGLLGGLRWASLHYVAPLAGLLSRATPPNLPRHIPDRISLGENPRPGPDHPISELARRSADGRRAPVTAMAGPWHPLGWIGALAPVLHAGKSVLVVAATVDEVRRLGEEAGRDWPANVVWTVGEGDAEDTAAWEAAQSPPRLIVGTPKTAAWQVPGLALAVILEEGRRAMKDRQTPTIHVRDMVTTRSRLEGFNVVFYGPTPSVELLSAGADVVKPANRAWPLVEVVDRSDDPPGSGYLSARVLAAIEATAGSGNAVFVFTHRRLGSASMRCTSCRALRSCAKCGTRFGREDACPSCATPAGACPQCGGESFEEMGSVPERLVGEINRRVGRDLAVTHGARGLVTVGTERDLAALDDLQLAVAVDVDGMLLGAGYRRSEEALRQLARLAASLRGGRGSRLMLQTSRPDSLLVATMRRGDPIPYLERVLVERAREGAPPATAMIAVEARGDIPDSAETDLAELEGTAVLGPLQLDDGKRWLLTGDLGKARLELRKVVARWRDKGATVRVDADPIDL